MQLLVCDLFSLLFEQFQVLKKVCSIGAIVSEVQDCAREDVAY